ncbi:SLC26A/SulP transporter family protein [Tardiphaga robiniae]|uniref:Bicarbonate transporter BicA n=1 Tax=Tardiphaga robiniae TaxID=943830 RepID=A0A109ZYP4_9BRAD|nr:SulP family inorganic anion transporter [Tardiphaga robiniae]AMH39649.1 Bicarbonate transporter BicA [Tardiphaga robiniae]KZD25598.1 sulfate permease [Tardiphaga robiniae]
MTDTLVSPDVLRAWRNDVFGGLIASVLTISFGLSYSVLIFTGPLASLLPYGISATFISASVIAAVIALGSSFPFAVAGPESSTAAVTAILAAALVEHIVTADAPSALLGPVLITLSSATIITGIVLCGFGVTRMGRAIRYVPYPVIGGFLGATACLIVAGAIQVITGYKLQWANLTKLANPMTLYELLAAAAVALTIYATWHRSRNPLGLPMILLGSVIAAHLVFRIAGVSVIEAQAMGWTFASPPKASLTLPWAFFSGGYPWQALPGLIGNFIAVIFVTAVSTLFNTTGLEVAAHREADIERELNATGAANILAGVLGGYAGCISISRSLLNRNSGATGRLSGLTVAAAAALMLVVDPALLAYMPRFVLGGLLLYLGLEQLHRWIVDSRKRLSLLDYLSLLAIIVIILTWGFVAGVLIGIVIGCATFALSVSRVSSIKYGFDGSEYRSSLDRSLEDQRTLAAHGREIQGLNLQSYLFFGSANRLYLHVKALLRRHPECRYLVFDFKLVTGIDSSAAHSFAQIKRIAEGHGTALVLANLHPSANRNLRASLFIDDAVKVMGELDHALEWCENEVIVRHRGLAEEEANLRDWFTKILRTADDSEELMRRCQRVEVGAGEIVVQAGDAADSMHFILDGRLGIMVPAGDGRLTRVRSLGRYTTVGEMGLVAYAPRSATIQAEIASVLYLLRADAFEDIKQNHPALSQKLLTYFVSVMAERLAFASRMIAVLRR